MTVADAGQGSGHALTDTELEFMNILWRLGEGTVNDVLDHLPAGRDLAYTSVSTILRILEKKGVLSSRKEGRSHVYVPRMSKARYEKASLDNILASVFEGAPAHLVRTLVETRSISPEDLKAIRKIIAERLKP